MFRIFYAEKDATLYEAYPDYNTGLEYKMKAYEMLKRVNHIFKNDEASNYLLEIS
jgi:hypothetical protein